MENCIICFEEAKYMYNKTYCDCKFYVHKKCYEEMRKYGLVCPICRKKKDNDDNIWYCFILSFIFILLTIIL